MPLSRTMPASSPIGATVNFGIYSIPGTIFAPSFMNQRHVHGMHGFDPQDADSAACWLTNHEHYIAPTRIEKIHDVMLAASRT